MIYGQKVQDIMLFKIKSRTSCITGTSMFILLRRKQPERIQITKRGKERVPRLIFPQSQWQCRSTKASAHTLQRNQYSTQNMQYVKKTPHRDDDKFTLWCRPELCSYPVSSESQTINSSNLVRHIFKSAKYNAIIGTRHCLHHADQWGVETGKDALQFYLTLQNAGTDLTTDASQLTTFQTHVFLEASSDGWEHDKSMSGGNLRGILEQMSLPDLLTNEYIY